MKKVYGLIVLVFITMACFNKAAAQFGTDVKILNNPSMQETAVSMDVAFNGWIYAVVSKDSGYVLRKSTDNGDTWSTFYQGVSATATFPYVKLVVAGTDTNNLTVILAGVRINTGVTGSIIYINRFNALTGAFIDQPFLGSEADIIRGIDLATDYKNPGTASSPYSVGLIYAQAGQYDSIMIVTSNNGGTAWNTPVVMDTTSRFFFSPSLAYGRSATSWSAGRFFAAYSRYQNIYDVMGHIYYAYTPVITNYVVGPYNIDNLSIGSAGFASNPKISCSTTADNDSAGITAIIAFERHYLGGYDQDIWYVHNMNAVNNGTWLFGYLDNSGDVTQQPDVSFDPAYSNFLFTYFDSTTGKMPYLVQGMNVETQPVATISSNYVDDTTSLVSPFPVIRINPALNRLAAAWVQSPVGSASQAMFDAEYRLPLPALTSLNPDTVMVGSAGFTLGVKGKNFVNTSVVNFNGVPATTTFINNDSLTIPVPAMDLAAVGTANVTVFNPTTTGGGGSSNGLIFYIVGPGGINEPTPAGTISIYPNPACNNLNINYEVTGSAEVEINMYDVNGNLVKKLTNTALSGKGLLNADVSNLATGVYQVVMQQGNNRSTLPISIAH